MRRKKGYAQLILFSFLFSCCPITNTLARERILLASGWHFQMDVSDLGEKGEWYAEKFDRSAWAIVSAGKPWDLYDRALWGYEGVGWYAASLSGRLARPGEIQYLRFARVNYHAKVWLNGKLLGENTNGNLPFEFDVTGLLAGDAANTLVVRVDNRPQAEWLPGATRIEWMMYGGLLGPVELASVSLIHITDLGIQTEPTGADATVSCDATLRNSTASEVGVRLRVSVPGMRQASESISVRILPGESTHRVSLILRKARQWSPESPALYVLVAHLEHSGKVLDSVSSEFGVRKVEVRGRDILLNGQRLQIRGVNRYDEIDRFGPNPPRALVLEDLRQMKKAGVNFVRVHYPQSPELISLYDRMGFLMMEEINLCWWTGEDDGILGQAMAGLQGLIRRDKNHPSIIIWSMANESGTDTESGIRVMQQLMRAAKRMDPSRLVTFVIATADASKHRAYAEADLVGFNAYMGLFEGEVARQMDRLDELVRKPTAQYVCAQARAFPDKPMVVTEFGNRGVYGIHGTVEYTEEFQAAFIEATWRGIQDCGQVSGTVLWAWADYYHRRDFIEYAVFGPYGVVTIDRRPKAALGTLAGIYGGSRQRGSGLSGKQVEKNLQ